MHELQHIEHCLRTLPPDGGLDTGALYRLCRFGGVVAPFANFVWENSAPSKVRFFGWLLVQDRILSRASLLKKHILALTEAVCPICGDLEETASHIVFSCSVASQFWGVEGGRFPPDADVRLLNSYEAPCAVTRATS